MKNLLYILIPALAITFASCEKEDIVIVNPVEDGRAIQTKAGNTFPSEGDDAVIGTGSDGSGKVTDPDDDDENFDLDTKNNAN